MAIIVESASYDRWLDCILQDVDQIGAMLESKLSDDLTYHTVRKIVDKPDYDIFATRIAELVFIPRREKTSGITFFATCPCHQPIVKPNIYRTLQAGASIVLTDLLQTIRGLLVGDTMVSAQGPVPISIARIDQALGGGFVHGLHEWFGPNTIDTDFKTRSLPIEIPVHLARRIQEVQHNAPWTVWVGQRCFPYPSLLADKRCKVQRLFNHAIFVDAETPLDRLWSIEQAMDSPKIGVIVADGSRFNMAATRRIQLRAQTHGTFVFVGRPLAELSELSAAQTRWLIRYEQSHSCGRALFVNPRWRVELLRCKGMRSHTEQGVWVLERDRATHALRLSAEVVHPASNDQTARQSA